MFLLELRDKVVVLVVIGQNSKRHSWKGSGSRCMFSGIIDSDCNALKYVYLFTNIHII